jgi:hypothetical protein
MTGPTPIFSIAEKFVNDEYQRLENAQITPWAFFNGNGLRVNDFYGKPIAYSGIRFSGSPVQAFWSGYIEPFLEDIAFRAVDLSMKSAAERKIPLREPLLEVRGQLHSLCRRAFDRMANIDQRLRKAGVLDEVPLRRTDKELARMHQFIDKRIDAELRAIPAAASRFARLNEWYTARPLISRAIGPAVAAVRHIAKFFGY